MVLPGAELTDQVGQARQVVRRTGRRAGIRPALMVVPAVFFAICFAYPVAAIVALGLRDGGRWQFARAAAVLTDPHTAQVLWFTLWQAAASTVLTVAVALPGCYVFARLAFPGKRLLRALVTVPFVLPTVVVGSAFLALVGRGGLLDEQWGFRLDTSVWAILLGHVFFNYAVVVRTVGGLWGHLDPRQEEAARLLGASAFAAWRRVTWPALAPAVAAAALMVFLFTFTSFGVIQILGGPRHSTLEVEIYRQTAQLLDLPMAAVLTSLQFVVVAVLLGVHGWTSRRRESALRLLDAAQVARRPAGLVQWALLWSVLVVIVLLLLTPLAVLVERSLAGPDGYGFRYYRALASAADSGGTFVVAPLEAVGNSLVYAVVATAIALTVGGLAVAALTTVNGPVRSGGEETGKGRRSARRGAGGRLARLLRGFDALLMLPLGTSAVTVGFGFLIALDEPPLDLRSSWILVPLAQALVGVPFVVRIMLPPLRAIDPRLREAAAVLGASPWRVWREVDLPLVWRALLIAAGFAFAVSLGEFGATVFIARPDHPTLPIAVARFLGRAGELHYGQAMALSTILMLVCAAALLALERVRPTQSGEF